MSALLSTVVKKKNIILNNIDIDFILFPFFLWRMKQNKKTILNLCEGFQI